MVVEISQALEIIENEVQKLASELVPIELCVDRVLAQDIIASYALPSFDNSAMDGYAVKVEDAGKTLVCQETIFAGDPFAQALQSGSLVKIMTGAPIPLGCDAIVPIEDVMTDESGVTLPESIKMGNHIRRKGEDIACGDLLLHSGEKIAAYHIALLASQGISQVKVTRRPKVAVFATGHELKMHFEQVNEHQIYNSNTPTFLARAKQWGAEVSFLGSAQDMLEDIKAYVQASLEADLVITSGGVSVGDADFTREAFDAFGLVRLFDKVNIKPGKPTSFGKIGQTYVLNLPGNPMAALVNFELFGLKAFLKLSGNRASYLGVIESVAKTPISIKQGRVTVLTGFYDGQSFEVSQKQSPSMISPLQTANAMVILDKSVSRLDQGSALKLISLHQSVSSAMHKDFVTL